MGSKYPLNLRKAARQCIDDMKNLQLYEFHETEPGIWEGDTTLIYHMVIDMRDEEHPRFTAIRKRDGIISVERELEPVRKKKGTKNNESVSQ